MNHEELAAKLRDKMASEQQEYRNFLLRLSPEDILNHTYEYTVRQDILMALDTAQLSDAQISALLESPAPLADVYKQFRDTETDYMGTIRASIETRASEVILFKQMTNRNTPIRQKSFGHEEKCGEMKAAREPPERTVKKPSVRAQLAAKSAQISRSRPSAKIRSEPVR